MSYQFISRQGFYSKLNSELINIVMEHSDKSVFGAAKPAGTYLL